MNRPAEPIPFGGEPSGSTGAPPFGGRPGGPPPTSGGGFGRDAGTGTGAPGSTGPGAFGGREGSPGSGGPGGAGGFGGREAQNPNGPGGPFGGREASNPSGPGGPFSGREGAGPGGPGAFGGREASDPNGPGGPFGGREGADDFGSRSGAPAGLFSGRDTTSPGGQFPGRDGNPAGAPGGFGGPGGPGNQGGPGGQNGPGTPNPFGDPSRPGPNGPGTAGSPQAFQQAGATAPPRFPQQGNPTGAGSPPGPAFGGAEDDWVISPPTSGTPGGGYGYPQPGSTPGATWMATVGPDRDYFMAMMQRSGPEAAGLNLPAYSPEQQRTLTGNQVTIGRRRHSTGETPDIDLSVPPEDPGVSHQHAVLVQQPDGTWAVVDQNSTNGTTVNNGEEPIQPFVPIPLQDGDRVHVGAWTTITIRRG